MSSHPLQQGRLIEPAPAKVNLTLQVGGAQNNGRHLLQSLTVFTQEGDTVQATPAKNLTLAIQGPFAQELHKHTPNIQDNLVFKAAKAMQLRQSNTTTPRGAHITLVKNLPIASGIGGGSANAAATVRLLSRLWRITLSPHETRIIVEKLGQDVMACLKSQSGIMHGDGTDFHAVFFLPQFFLLLVNSRQPLSTSKVYQCFDTMNGTSPALPLPTVKNEVSHFITNAITGNPITRNAITGNADNSPCLESLVSYMHARGNTLLGAAVSLQKNIAPMIKSLQSHAACLYAGMSGSGGTCFGLYETAHKAERAKQELQTHYPDYWMRVTRPLH